MNYEVLTGLSTGQLLMLTARCAALAGDVARPGGRPPAIGLLKSVALVVHLMRRNPVQAVAGAMFGVSQPTASRRWDLLRPIIRKAVAGFIPAPHEVIGAGTALVDGTIAPTWDWKHIPDLFCGKEDMPGINIQVAATLGGDIAAVGPFAVRGARHDAFAFEASGLKDILAGIHAAADLEYVGVEGIDIVPVKRMAAGRLDECQTEFNVAFSKSAPRWSAPSPISRHGVSVVMVVGAVDRRDDRTGVEQEGHAGRFRRPRMISSCRSARSPRPDSQIPVIDRCRLAASWPSGSAAGASSGSEATSTRSRSAWRGLSRSTSWCRSS